MLRTWFFSLVLQLLVAMDWHYSK